MVRTGRNNFWRGLTCHMAILSLPSGISSSRINHVPADADSATLKQRTLASDIAQKWLAGHPPRRVIVVLRKFGESGAMKPRWPLEMGQATLKNSGRGVIFPGSYRCRDARPRPLRLSASQLARASGLLSSIEMKRLRGYGRRPTSGHTARTVIRISRSRRARFRFRPSIIQELIRVFGIND